MGLTLEGRRDWLQSPDPKRRRAALASLAQGAPDEEIEAVAELAPLVRALGDDPDGKVRELVPWVLDLLLYRDGFRGVPDRLRDPDWRVRFRALVLFTRSHDPSRELASASDLAEALADLVRDEHSRIRRLAVVSLGLLGPASRPFEDAIVGFIPRTIRQRPDDETARQIAALALWAIGATSEGGLSALLELLATEAPGQEEAATALGDFARGHLEAASWLELVAGGGSRARNHALLALANVAPARALAVLQIPTETVAYDPAWNAPPARSPGRRKARKVDEGRRVLAGWCDWPVAERAAWSTDEGLSDYLAHFRALFGEFIDSMSTARFLEWRREQSPSGQDPAPPSGLDYYGNLQWVERAFFQAVWQIGERALSRRVRITRRAPLLVRVDAAGLAARVADGRLAERQLELAAYVGNRAARELLPVVPEVTGNARSWYCGLARFGREVMVRAHLAVGYLVLPILAMQDSSVAPGVNLLDIEEWLRHPSDDWTGAVDVAVDRRNWGKKTVYGAGMAIASIPVPQRDPVADALVFDCALQALTGRSASGFVEHPDEPYRLRPRNPSPEIFTSPVAAAPDLIRRKVGEELALWGLGLFDPLSEGDD